ncbi:unnamed protein product [Peniophora sp. CBMAI 1063]|nr:unnamed protein product [Peniophora sp. CBMAI 1063]
MQYDALNSMDIDVGYPSPGYAWPSFLGAPVGVESEKPAFDLEREVCSNFTCCGLILPDMHALVDHFEETHVFAPKPEHTRLYVLPEDRPPAPLPRLVIPFPRFLTPPPADRVPVSYDSPSSPLWSDGLPSPVIPSDYLPSYLEQPHASPSSSHPPAFFSPNAPRKRPSKLKVRERVDDRSKRRRSGSSPSKRERERAPRPRDRGRIHVCPHPDCVKTYLNPNGLKYHVEKGTCQAQDGSAIERIEVLQYSA